MADWMTIDEYLTLFEAREILEDLVEEEEFYNEDWVREYKFARNAKDGDIIGGSMYRKAFKLTKED